MIPFYFPRQDSVGKSRDFLRAEGLSIAPNGVEVWATDSAGNLVFGAASGLQIQFATGTAALPGAAFAAQTGTGFFLTSTNRTGWSSAGVQALEFNSNGLDLIKNTSTIRLGASSDVILAWDAANTLALRNATTTQRLNLYGTFTDSSNYERVSLRGTGAAFLLESNSGGTGTARSLQMGTTGSATVEFYTNNTNRWKVDASGHFVAIADNTYDIGASGAARARDIFGGRSLGVSQAASGVTGVISVPTGGELRFGANSAVLNVGDGVLRFRNNGDSGFTRLILGTNDTAATGASLALVSGQLVPRAGDGTAAPGVGRSTAQTAAVATVATFTVGSSDASFIVSANALVTASTTHSFSIQMDYTDEGNTSRSVTFNVQQLGGTLVTSITNVTGVGPYEGIPLHIRAKAATAITVKTTGTFTSVTYNVEGVIRQIA